MKKQKFEMNFNGQSDNGMDYGCGMRIAGHTDIIGRMFAEYAHYEAKRGHPEPMQIFIAMAEQMKRFAEKESKIIIPSIVKPGLA
jgi:hypothetical protein